MSVIKVKIKENENNIYYRIIDDNVYFMKQIKNRNKDNIDMLKNEIIVLEKLKGLNVPEVSFVDIQNGIIIYKYIKGENINDLYINNIIDVLKLMLKILDIVIEIHNRGIIHCDLKPSNIMLYRDKVYIIDFGIASALGHTSFLGYGSPLYCSPEQIKNQNLTIHSDIYSIGIIMYKLFTGKLPFTSKNNDRKEILTMHLKREIVIPSEINSHIPNNLDLVIKKCMEKEIINRYNCVQEIKRDLIIILDDLILNDL